MKLAKRWAGILLLVISLAALVWGFWPAGRQARALQVAPQELFWPEETVRLPQGLRLRLEWPERMRSGEAGDIYLTVELERGQGDPEQGADFYTAYRLAAEARLEMADMAYTPPGEVVQALPMDRAARFHWQIVAAASGAYPGEVWVYLRLAPLNGEQPLRTVLAAQKLDLQVHSLFGLSSTSVRAAGSVGMVLAVTLLLDEWVWGKRRATR